MWPSVPVRKDLHLFKVQTHLRLAKQTQILCLTYGPHSASTLQPLYLFRVHCMSPSPSNEWQDRVVAMINGRPSSLPQPLQDYHSPKSEVSEDSISHTRKRQRRRVGTEDHPLRAALQVSESPSAPSLHEARSSTSRWYQTPSPGWVFPESGSADKIDRRSSSIGSEALDSGSEEELLSAVGQLSINEDEQIRYHGKASGIYLLRKKERLDQRNEGDIWLVSNWCYSNIGVLIPCSQEISKGTRLAPFAFHVAIIE